MRLPLARLVDTTRPLEGPGRWWRAAMFGSVAGVGVVVTAALPAPRLGAVWLAAALTVMIVGATALPWRRWPSAWQSVPAFGYFGVALLLDYASGPEQAPVFVTAVTVIWVTLFHPRWLVLAGFGLLALVLFLPPVLMPDAYPMRPWGTIVMAFALSVLGGLAGHELVTRHRNAVRAMAQALGRARVDRDLRDAYLATAGALVMVMSPAGKVILFNRHSEQVTGYRSDEIVEDGPWHLFPPEGPFRDALAGLPEADGPVGCEDDLIARSGQRRRVVWVLTGLTNDEGQVWSTIAVGMDVTEQREIQRLLENVLAAAVDQMIFAVDTTGTFTVFNRGGERLLGYRAEEVVGTATIDMMLPPDEAAVVREAGLERLREKLSKEGGSPALSLDRTLVARDGSDVPVSISLNSIREAGTVLGYVGVAWDVTAQREAAEAMAQALDRERSAARHARELDQAKSEFVATVSHDLRTPLTSIVGNTELLLGGDAGPLSPPQRQLLAAIDRNSRRLDTLVRDLLLLAHIESGAVGTHARPVSLAEVVDGALEALAGTRSPDLDVRVSMPRDPLLIHGDPDQLERVVVNLVGNALKFTPPGGQVRIAAAANGQRAELRVTDTGIGIPEEELPRVFERFFRSSRSQDRERPGTGLGLSIAKSIVDYHGGTIHAGVTPGGGTTFVISLPRHAPPRPLPKERERREGHDHSVDR